jgi:hypothetical protein
MVDASLIDRGVLWAGVRYRWRHVSFEGAKSERVGIDRGIRRRNKGMQFTIYKETEKGKGKREKGKGKREKKNIGSARKCKGMLSLASGLLTLSSG